MDSTWTKEGPEFIKIILRTVLRKGAHESYMFLFKFVFARITFSEHALFMILITNSIIQKVSECEGYTEAFQRIQKKADILVIFAKTNIVGQFAVETYVSWPQSTKGRKANFQIRILILEEGICFF